MSEAQIAVLIDYENVGLNSIRGLFDQLSDLGRVIVKRAYADWSSAGKQRDHVLELGIEAVHHFHAAKVAKNSSDISLAIDAVDLLYRSPVDTFVIVSADSDFVTLVSKLRSAGKTVIGAGRRDVVSTTLVRACDRYIYLESPSKAPPVAPKPTAVTADVESLLQRAIEVSADSDGRVVGSKLHQTMTRIEPSFDFKALGYRTFTQFLESAATVQITKEKNSNDILVKHKNTGFARIPGIGGFLSSRSRRTPIATEQEATQTPVVPATPISRAAPVPRRTTTRPQARPRPVAPNLISPRRPVTNLVPPTSSVAQYSPLQPPTHPLLNAESKSEATSVANGVPWDMDIHQRWASRVDQTSGILNGTRAAAEAARVLGVPKLSLSRYKTLQALLSSSPVLSMRWTREGNTLHVKTSLASGSNIESTSTP